MALSPAYAKHPEHPLSLAEEKASIRVRVGDVVIAETRRGLELQEGSYRPVVYVPRQDVRMELLERSDHSTHCPFKGDANYFDFTGDLHPVEQLAWSYEDPYDQMAAICDHLAFYPDRATIEPLAD